MKKTQWVSLTVVEDSKYNWSGRREMHLQPSHILSMCEVDNHIYGAKAEVVLREPDDGFNDNDTEVRHGLRTLWVLESISQIRGLINVAEDV